MVCVSNTHNPFATDKNTIWAACLDSTVTIWNSSLCLLRRLSLGTSSATSLAAVNHDVYIADAKHIYIFDSQTYKRKTVVDLPRLSFITTLPDAASNSAESPVQDPPHALLRSVPTVANLNRLAPTGASTSTSNQPTSPESDSKKFNGYFVRCIAPVKRFVWVSTDGFVCFLDSKTRTFVPGVHIDVPKINSIAFIESTNQVWGACSDGCLYVWDADVPLLSGKIEPVKKLSGWTTDRVSRVVNYQDNFVYTATWDKKMRVWDAKTVELIYTSPRPHECPIMALVILPYPWLKVYPQASKSPAGSQITLTGTTTTASKENPSVERRAAQSLPVQSTTTSSSDTITKSPNPETSNVKFAGEPQEMTIMTVFTADWSSVSQWL